MICPDCADPRCAALKLAAAGATEIAGAGAANAVSVTGTFTVFDGPTTEMEPVYVPAAVWERSDVATETTIEAGVLSEEDDM